MAKYSSLFVAANFFCKMHVGTEDKPRNGTLQSFIFAAVKGTIMCR